MDRNIHRTGFLIQLLAFASIFCLAVTFLNTTTGLAEAIPGCSSPGWFPVDFGLKDHAVFWYGGHYYVVATYVPSGDPSPLAQDRFMYARSTDLCSWEELKPIISDRKPGNLDDTAVWAPFVFEEEGIYYLYYTGVTQDWTQSILLAKTTNPADPSSWQKDVMVFQPSHPGAIWEAGQHSDCRDPFVTKQADQYYLYYTGLDSSGGVLGVATAASPSGPWRDLGSIVNPTPGEMFESPTIAKYDQYYYLFYNLPRTGEYYRIGSSLTGNWLNPVTFSPGWAHEIWRTPRGKWMISYLTNYSITIAQVVWGDYNNIPHPTIQGFGTDVYLPLVRKK